MDIGAPDGWELLGDSALPIMPSAPSPNMGNNVSQTPKNVSRETSPVPVKPSATLPDGWEVAGDADAPPATPPAPSLLDRVKGVATGIPEIAGQAGKAFQEGWDQQPDYAAEARAALARSGALNGPLGQSVGAVVNPAATALNLLKVPGAAANAIGAALGQGVAQVGGGDPDTEIGHGEDLAQYLMTREGAAEAPGMVTTHIAADTARRAAIDKFIQDARAAGGNPTADDVRAAAQRYDEVNNPRLPAPGDTQAAAPAPAAPAAPQSPPQAPTAAPVAPKPRATVAPVVDPEGDSILAQMGYQPDDIESSRGEPQARAAAIADGRAMGITPSVPAPPAPGRLPVAPGGTSAPPAEPEVPAPSPAEPTGDGSRENPVQITQPADIQAAEQRIDTDATPAQIEAGNYRKGHVEFDGLPISIETPTGGTRSGVGADGTPWSVQMPGAYGYFKGSVGADGEHIDALIGNQGPNGKAFVIDQNDANTGDFDEHKVVLGAASPGQAANLYQQSFADGRHRMGTITEVTTPELKDWLAAGPQKEPFVRPSKLTLPAGWEEVPAGTQVAPPSPPVAPKVPASTPRVPSSSFGQPLPPKQTPELQGTSKAPVETPAVVPPRASEGAPAKDIEPPAGWPKIMGRDPIGMNPSGFPIYEDQNGVRSIYKGRGIRVTEPVGMRPTRNGVQPIVSRDHAHEYQTVEEREAKPPAELAPGNKSNSAEPPPPLAPEGAPTRAPVDDWADRIAAAHRSGGPAAATEEYRKIVADEKPTTFSAAVLGDKLRKILKPEEVEAIKEYQAARRAAPEKAAAPEKSESEVSAKETPAAPVKEKEPESYWEYKSGPIPTFEGLDPGVFKGTQKQWESLSPGMRQEIVRSHEKQAAKSVNAPDNSSPFDPKKSPADAVADHLYRGNSFANIVEARKFVGENGGNGQNLKQVDETVENGVVKAARAIVSTSSPGAETYSKLVDLYGRQPKLTTRTSTSVDEQAYSTPAPLAYIASRQAGITDKSKVYEPTAGNGMLLIGADPAKARVNEINADRREALKSQGFSPTNLDASVDRQIGKHFDVVIANPPFGAVRDDDGQSKVFDMSDIQPGYKTHEIDHAIALRALEAMKDDGRAVLILGGVNKLAATDEARSNAYNGKAKREFFKTLYDNYNVVDHFGVAGELYERQGAGWTTDVIVIDGRGKSALKLPAAAVPPMFKSWGELESKANGAPREARPADRQPAGAPVVEPEQIRPPGKPATDTLPVQGERSGAGRRGSGRGEPTPVRPELDSGQRQAPSVPVAPVEPPVESGRHSEPAGAGEQPDTEPSRPRVSRPAQQETESQTAYKPRSKQGGLGTLVPSNMSTATHDALESLQHEHGSLDSYVGKALGMNQKELGDAFAAEQIDALALAIHNIQKGAGFIIGDQTGVGKGRVNAGVLRYAIREGHVPIFMTEKNSLYKDIYRDLSAVGIQKMLGREPKMLMTDGGAKIPLDDEESQFLTSPELGEHNKYLESLIDKNKLPDHDMLLTTYSQMQTVKGESTVRRRLLESLAPHSVIAMDESHNAGGTENKRPEAGAPPDRAALVRMLAKNAKGVLYSSATYAKRPSVMSLYHRTDMRKAVKKESDLAPAIERGGVPMQQVVAAMLAKGGQYIRREQSFKGIDYTPFGVKVDHEAYANVAKSLASINDFSHHVAAATKGISKGLRDSAEAVGADNATGDAGAKSLNFTSVMHNLIDQLLLSMKSKGAVDEALASLRKGEKPVITVANTMESFLNKFAEHNDINPGDVMDMRFNDLLHRYLDRTREISIRKPFMKKGDKAIKHYMTDEELGPMGRASYAKAKQFINQIELGNLPISPIDYIHNELHRAGYKTGELTGRSGRIDYSGNKPVFARRSNREIGPRGRIQAVSDFNAGKIDALIINRAGAAGISAHSSETFADQKPRHMIIAQPENNIDLHMQILGRVNRTGQVNLPRYTQLVADVPAETRPASNLLRKMGSLNAATTAAKGHALSLGEHVPDFMNKYGDQVAEAVMRENPDVNKELDYPIDLESKEGNDGAMRKLTGRIPLIPQVKRQAQLYKVLTDSYLDYLKELEASGENALEAKRLELDARTIESAEVRGGDGSSPFTQPVNLETLDVKKVGKPYKTSDLIDDAGMTQGFSRQWIDANVDGDLSQKSTALAAVERKGAIDAKSKMDAALTEFGRFKKEYLADIDKDTRYQATMAKFDDNEARFRSLMPTLSVGSRVTIKLPDENMSGIIVKLHKTGDAQNPIALGSWKADLAVPGRGRIQFSLGRLYTGDAKPGGSEDTFYQVHGAEHEPMQDTLTRFDQMAAQSREKRMMLTGNLLAAYDFAKHRGQIVNFTRNTGALDQGILLPQTYRDAKAVLEHAGGTPMETAQEVLAHIEETKRPLSSIDGAVSLIPKGTGRHHPGLKDATGDLVIAVPASKLDGGKYFLNSDLRAALRPIEFTKRGTIMRAELNRWTVENRGEAIITALMKAGASFDKPIALPAKEPLPDEPVASAFSNRPGTGFDVPKSSGTAATAAKLEPEDKAALERAANVVKEIIQRVAGEHASGLQIENNLVSKSSDSWGAPAGNPVLGLYHPITRAIMLSLRPIDEMVNTAYHEAGHALDFAGAIPDRDHALLEHEMPRLRQMVQRSYGFSKEIADDMPEHEVKMYAFGDWAHTADRGEPDTSGLHVGVKRIFSRLLATLRRIGNFFRGKGFRTSEDVFKSMFKGEYAKHTEDGLMNGALAWWYRSPEDRDFHQSLLEDMQRHDPSQAVASVLSKVRDLVSTPSSRDKFLENFVDFNHPVKKFQEGLESQREGPFPDSMNMYGAKRLYGGKLPVKEAEAERNFVKPMMDQARADGLTRQEIGEDLYARHAPERNAYIASINPNMPAGGSGMTDERAAEIRDRNDSDPVRAVAFERAAQAAQKVRMEELNTRVRAGLLTQAQADEWVEKMPNYVPVRGWEAPDDDDDASIGGFSRKFTVFGKESPQAMGRRTMADDPLSNLMHGLYRAIDRAERNKVTVTVANALKNMESNGHDMSDVVRFDKGEPTRYIDPTTDLVTSGTKPINPLADNVVSYKTFGKNHYMVFKDAKLAMAIKRMSPDQLGWLGKNILTVQNKIKSWWTHYSPDFLVRHFLSRYPIEGALNFQEIKDLNPDASTIRYLKDGFATIPTIMKTLAGKPGGNPKYKGYIDEMRAQGGMVEFRSMMDLDLVKQKIERSLQDIGSTRAKLRDVRKNFDDLSTAMDNGLRAASYIQHREAGLSPMQAALKARDATIDYAKRGVQANRLGVWFPFFNTSIQTGARFASAAVRSKAIRRAIAATIAAGFVAALWNYLMGGSDDNGEPYIDKIPDYEKALNFTLLNPFDRDVRGRPNSIHLPLPYNWAFPLLIGSMMGSMVMHALGFSKRTPAQAAGSVGKSLLQAFTPFGDESNPYAYLVPELARPAIHVGTNEDWTGFPIHRDQQGFPGQVRKSNAASGFPTTGEGYKAAAGALNAATGGNEFSHGALDLYPEDIRAFVNELVGAQVSTAGRVANMAAGKADASDPDQVPVERVFRGQDYDRSDRSSFYDDRAKAEAVANQINGFRKSGQNPEANAIQRQNPGMIVSPSAGSKSRTVSTPYQNDNVLKGIYHQMDTVNDNKSLSDAEKDQKLDNLRQQEVSRMNAIRRRVDQRSGAHP